MIMYTGTSTEQDSRFCDKEKKLIKQTKFKDCLTQQVDMTKVKLNVLKPWITKKITEILEMEDEVVIDYVNNQLEERFPCPKKMQINLTGFLNVKNARIFMGELWELLLSAQLSKDGIPECLTHQKKEEIKKRIGTSIEQDSRFCDKEKKLMNQTKVKDCSTQQVKQQNKKNKDKDRSWSRSHHRSRRRSRDRRRSRSRSRDRSYDRK